MPLTLSGNTGIAGVDGSASVPSVQGSDTNTGEFFPAADTIAWTTGGSERMRVDSSGNVGIGTSSPSYKFEVNSGSNAYSSRMTSTTANALLAFGDSGTTSIGPFVGSAGNALTFGRGGVAEYARIDSSGNLLVGTTTSTSRLTVVDSRYGTANAGTAIVSFSDSNSRYSNFYAGADGNTFNAANTILGVRQANGTGRSINASGTINASGADYAEYMTKAGDFVIAKGDIVGINAEGKLTNVFSDAVSFAVKSTNPSYVGGDTWGNEEAVGERPSSDATQEEQDAFNKTLEVARQKVDRIAFAGQVPANVFGATAGQYIIPINDNGAIKGEAVSNPTFEQYQIAVGKVIAVEDDGRAKIIVKVA